MYGHKLRAFTMFELVMVIVVLGILAAMALPRMERDIQQEAADNVLSAIRYTQHLALMDNKENPSSNRWQRALWQIRFNNYGGDWVYSVWTNADYDNNVDLLTNEAAIDPANGKLLHSPDATMDNGESPNIFLTQNYGITNVTINGCQNQGPNAPANPGLHIAFDYMGRPHRGVTVGGNRDYRTAITQGTCQLIFTTATGTFRINIAPETGYAWIQNQNAS